MLKNKKSFFADNQYIFIAFLATSVTMLAVYLCNGMIPFGDKTILRMDLYHQYGPLFAELYDIVKEGGSFLYSWKSGLGSCFLGNYFNYLSSPIGAIIMFFGHKNIPEAIGAMVLIKAALSASAFNYYVKNSLKRQSFASVSFGVLYAFCGYMLAYYWNIMWLDAMILLPVVLLGIERIIDHGKPATYITGLALTMFSNYYMSYMICIFSVIYFCYYYIVSYENGAVLSRKFERKNKGIISFLSNHRFFRTGIIFAFSSLAAAGLMAFVLLPVYNVLKSSSATSGSFPEELKNYFTFFDFFANHLASLETTIRSSGDDVLPNVYCGVITLILAPLFFFTKSISKKEKVATLALLVVLFFSFNVNFLNYIWHGFHFPNDLPYRQSFIYSFILLLMAYKVFIRLNEFTSGQICAVGVGLVAFVFIVEDITSKNVNSATVLLTLALIVLYVVILALFKDKRYQSSSLALLLLVCICSEAVMCDSSRINITITKDSYASDYDDFKMLKDALDTAENDEFYRMELTDLRTRMDPCWYGYNGASVFSSMAFEKLSNLQDDLGMMSNRINSYTYNPQTPVYNMMFSLKYIVNNASPNTLESPFYSPSLKSDKFSAYKNNYHLPIAYCIDSKAEKWATEEYMDIWKIDTGSDPFMLQGDYFKLATGVDNPFEKMDISYVTYSNVSPFTESLDGTNFNYSKTTPDADGSAVLYLTTEKKGNVYIYFDVTGASEKSVSITSSLGTITQNAHQNCIFDLGYFDVNETITVTIPFENNNGTLKFNAYTINEDKFNKGYEILSDSQMLVEEFNDTNIKGRVTAKKDCLLYTSIPYDKGWKIVIDGTELSDEKIFAFGGGLLAAKIEKGNHDIEFIFEAQGLKGGFTVSFFTAAIILLLIVIKKIKNKFVKINRLPSFTPIDYGYSEELFLQSNNTEKSNSECITVRKAESSELPKKEIFYPAEPYVKKEIFEPEQSIEIEQIDI
ncbi:MAG: YfhO family protein [Clostridia bacterium]|nr:YfhO family protein [Clostridia bacterium]